MFSKRNQLQVAFLALLIVVLLGLPAAAGAQAGSGITSPKDGAALRGSVEITGTASSPNFLKWQLDLLLGNDPNKAAFLSFGTNEGAFSYNLATNLYPDGEYGLRLRTVTMDSNYTEQVVKVTFANAGPAPAAAPAAKPEATKPVTPTVTAKTAVTPTVVVKAPVTPTVAAKPAATAKAAALALPTTNGIASPKEGAAVEGKVEVIGFASNPNFMKWQLDFLPGGNPDQAIFLAWGPQQGVFTQTVDFTPYAKGEHALRLRVVKNDSNYDEFVTKFSIGPAKAAAAPAKPAATAPVTPTVAAKAPVTPTVAAKTAVTPTVAAKAPVTPTVAAKAAPAAAEALPTKNGIASPAEGAKVSGDFKVVGFAANPNFMKWQLDLLPGGNSDSAIFLTFGSTQGVFKYTVNTTNLPAGDHVLRLRVVKNDSNYDEYVTKFTLAK